MQIKYKRVEQVLALLLFLGISAFMFLKADKLDAETSLYYLAGAGILWVIPCFLYVFIRDAIIVMRWKKPAFSLPQYEKEDVELEKLMNEATDWGDDPGDPSSPIYAGNIGLRSLSKK